MISSIPIWILVVQLQPIYLPLGYFNFFQEITTVMDIHFDAILGKEGWGQGMDTQRQTFRKNEYSIEEFKTFLNKFGTCCKNPLNQNTKREIVLRF